MALSFLIPEVGFREYWNPHDQTRCYKKDRDISRTWNTLSRPFTSTYAPSPHKWFTQVSTYQMMKTMLVRTSSLRSGPYSMAPHIFLRHLTLANKIKELFGSNRWMFEISQSTTPHSLQARNLNQRRGYVYGKNQPVEQKHRKYGANQYIQVKTTCSLQPLWDVYMSRT